MDAVEEEFWQMLRNCGFNETEINYFKLVDRAETVWLRGNEKKAPADDWMDENRALP